MNLPQTHPETGADILPVMTSFEQANTIVSQLAERKDAWTQVSIPERITYLQQCIEGVDRVAPVWAKAACLAKGIDPATMLAGEEWLIGPAVTLSYLQQLIKTLQANGQPQPLQWSVRQGQTVAKVFPNTPIDRLLWMGFRGEVWLQPGQPRTQGKVYRQPSQTGQVALVLGAGNVSSIAPLDMLYKLFAENAVVLLKMNPVNEYLGPLLEQAFQPLRAAGFLHIVYGGASLGSYLCQHPQVDTIHITGSHQTYDAIVWGSSLTERTQRKAAHQPINPKPITAELGCVTPVIVVPGNWSEADLAFQARQVAGMVVHNASFNCAAAKVLITASGWPQREKFLNQVRQELSATPPRTAYYPGAKQRYVEFLERYPQAQAVNSGSDEIVPWTLIPEVPAQADEYALTHEAFCGVLAEVSLEATQASQFLSQAVEFVNDRVWGNLSCTVLVDPVTQKQCAKELEGAIADLRYGAIGINVWSGVIYSLPTCTWGAFPGNSIEDIRSGQGVVHNTYLFEHPQKSVLYAPFRIRPLPMWFARHQNLLPLTQQFTRLQAKPSWSKVLGLMRAAFKG